MNEIEHDTCLFDRHSDLHKFSVECKNLIWNMYLKILLLTTLLFQMIYQDQLKNPVLDK